MRKSIVFSLAALLFAASCSNDPELVQTGTAKREIQCEFSATLPEFKSGGELETKASLESVVRIKWSAGDRLTVINLTQGTQMGGYLLADREGYNTTFTPTNLNGAVNAGDKLVFWYNTTDDISVAEEKAFSPISVDLTEQNGGQNNVPIVGYAEYTATEDGVIEAENLQFVFLVSYVQLALSALPASTSITAFEVNNVNSTGEFRIEDGRFVFAKSKGKVKLVDPFTANTKGANVRYFSLFASEAEASARMATITANGQDHETAWIKAGLNAGSYYQSVATGFANENIQFVDEAFMAYCVSHYDGNNDGEVSFAEAAAVTSYAPFTAAEKEAIRSVYELAYFPANIGIPSFEGCTGLERIILPGTLSDIPENTFKDCRSMREINIPDNVRTVGKGVFEGCSSLQYFSGILASNDNTFLIDEEKNLLAYAPYSHNNLIIPSDVRTIAPGVFQNCSNIKSVMLSQITNIGADAFRGCTSLASLNIVQSIEEIGANAFDGCTSLERVYSMRETPATIGNGAFSNCHTNLMIFVSENNKSAYDNSSWNIYDLRSRVWHQIFYTTTDGQPLEFESRNLQYAYANNSMWWQDQNITLLSNVYQEGRGTLTFSGDIITLGEDYINWSEDDEYSAGYVSMFTGQSRLETLTLPDCMVKMPDLRGCNNLREVSIPEAVTGIVNWGTPDNIERFTGSHVSPDGRYIIFNDCLTKAVNVLPANLTVPDYVTSIGAGAFGNCMTLRNVTINDNIKTIYGMAFRPCQIESYRFTSVEPPLLTTDDGWQFWFVEEGGVILVPEAAVDNYKTTTGWEEYIERIVGF